MKTLQFTATDDVYEHLIALKVQTGAKDIAQVVAWGTALLEHHVKATTKGNEIHVVYPDDMTRSTRIIMPYEEAP